MKQPIYLGNIAGLSHSKPDLSMLAPSNQLHVQPEPTNQFDPRAIRVIHPAAGKLGYIPKESTEAIHTAWTNGFEIEAKITEVLPGQRYDKVLIAVLIDCEPAKIVS